MSSHAGRPRPSVDSIAAPVNFYTEGPTDALHSQPQTGTRRGSFLFRSESDEVGAPLCHSNVMTGSASDARLTSMVPSRLHEMFVITIPVIDINEFSSILSATKM